VRLNQPEAPTGPSSGLVTIGSGPSRPALPDSGGRSRGCRGVTERQRRRRWPRLGSSCSPHGGAVTPTGGPSEREGRKTGPVDRRGVGVGRYGPMPRTHARRPPEARRTKWATVDPPSAGCRCIAGVGRLSGGIGPGRLVGLEQVLRRWIVTLGPHGEVVHEARSRQVVHWPAKSACPDPSLAKRTCAVLAAGQVEVPASRSTWKSSWPKRPSCPFAGVSFASTPS